MYIGYLVVIFTMVNTFLGLLQGRDLSQGICKPWGSKELIPDNIRVMALTATATVATRKAVCRTLGMVNPAVISESPNKVNIKYVVHLNPGTLEETFAPLVEEVRRCRSTTDRTIVFCRTYDSCA